MATRAQRRIDLHYRLAGPRGVTPSTMEKVWFFDLPVSKDTPDGWRELLHRLFYDANVKMKSQQPSDPNWLSLDRWVASPVEAQTMMAWDGAATRESARRHLPWVLAHFDIVWEFAGCYFIDDSGAYDGMEGYDFAELILYRALEAQVSSEHEGRAFMNRLYPRGSGDEYFNDRANRYRNLLGVRPTSAYRKQPGSLPWSSGPV